MAVSLMHQPPPSRKTGLSLSALNVTRIPCVERPGKNISHAWFTLHVLAAKAAWVRDFTPDLRVEAGAGQIGLPANKKVGAARLEA
jgi:hypothetical protein